MKCVKPCDPGYGFRGEESSDCIECPTTIHQGLSHGVCLQCELNELFDIETLKCINKNDYNNISAFAYDQCWLCSNPSDLSKCLIAASTDNNFNIETFENGACTLKGKKQTSTISSSNSASSSFSEFPAQRVIDTYIERSKLVK